MRDFGHGIDTPIRLPAKMGKFGHGIYVSICRMVVMKEGKGFCWRL
jgi:hypothetical protein